MAGRADDAIGIFDSGVGGLTVFRQVARKLPHEPIIYLGDTARVPYGTKSSDTVVRYARACAAMLIERGIKLLVIACNTASAFALETLQEELDIPVLGVIEPGASAAIRISRSMRIGVIGTPGTMESQQYPQALKALAPEARVFCRACPLFVPLAEEGWVDGDVPRLAAARYLADLIAQEVDTLVLGCTHYPLLKDVIGEVMGPQVHLVDSAEAVADVVAEVYEAMHLGTSGNVIPEYRFLVSDAPDRFACVGERFLGQAVANVEWVDF